MRPVRSSSRPWPPASSQASPRTAAALVLALVVLAALLLLGLPFLFSQSSALGGARSTADRQQASIARDSAEGIAHGLLSDANATWAAQGGADSSFLPRDLITTLPAPPANLPGWLQGGPPSGSYQVHPQLYQQFGFNDPNKPRDPSIGFSFADESGKLDPNSMGPAAWDALLFALHIPDWDDDAVADSRSVYTDPSGLWHDAEDANHFGELAEALAGLRTRQNAQGEPLLPGGRITHLEQLLLADPGYNTLEGQPYQDPVNKTWDHDPGANNPSQGFGFRRPLSRLELEVLRPHLTFHNAPPGRDGLIDLGTVVWAGQVPNRTGYAPGPWTYFIDGLDDFDPRHPLVGPGTTLSTSLNANWPTRGTLDQGKARISDSSRFCLHLDSNTPRIAETGTMMAIAAPAAVNVNAAGAGVLAAFTKDGTTTPAQWLSPLAPLGNGSPVSALLQLNDLGIYLRTDPLSTGRELPPLDILSQGIVSITSAGTVTDPTGRHAVSQGRQIIAQALPQEQVLEKRWQTQAQFQALIQQRFASRMMSWPLPFDRIYPGDPDLMARASLLDPTDGVGVSAAPLWTVADLHADPATRPFLPFPVDWSWNLRDTANRALRWDQASTGQQPVVGSPTISQLRPDGLLVTQPLAIANEAVAGNGLLTNTVNAPQAELKGRHIDLWITPLASWAGTIVPLWELRGAQDYRGSVMGNATDTVPRLPGSVEEQNFLGLYCDATVGRPKLVLVFAPPSIEHPADLGPAVPSDDPLTLLVNEASLAGGSTPLAPRAQLQGPPIRLTPLFTSNRIVHCYDIGDANGNLALTPGRAAHVQVILGGAMAGQFQIVVDDIVGRELGRSGCPTDFEQFGDHACFPGLILDTPLTGDTVGAGQDLLRPGTIRVRSIAGLLPEDLFPKRGTLRIDDEDIFYDGLSGNDFLHCVRGARQDTWTGQVGTPLSWVPLLQEHAPGARVVPGGYRLSLSGGSIFRGGCQLSQDLGPGDGVLGSIWASMSASSPTLTPAPGLPGQVQYLDSQTYLDIAPNVGAPDQFPRDGGVLAIRGADQEQYLYYTAYDGVGRFTLASQTPGQSSSIRDDDGTGNDDGWLHLPHTLPPSTDPFAAFPARVTITFPSNQPPFVQLVSIGVTSSATVNPQEPGRYSTQLTQRVGAGYLMQFLNAATQRAEWIEYQHISRAPRQPGVPDRYFLIHRQGWNPSTRGQQRTIRLSDQAWPANTTQLIPVQTQFDSTLGHRIATGDVVTLLPRNSANRPLPWQVVVRLAATDGYGADPADTVTNGAFDCKNEWFALSAPLPDDQAWGTWSEFEWLCGTCWGGMDLSTFNSTPPQPRGYLPRLDRCAAPVPPGPPGSPPPAPDLVSGAQVYLGSADPRRPGVLDALLAPPGSVIIDDVTAGTVDGATAPTQAPSAQVVAGVRPFQGVWFNDAAPDPARFILKDALGDDIVSSQDTFLRPCGLACLDGEVIAYQAVTPRRATIIGRGLLASASADHLVGPGLTPDRFVYPTLLTLPIGPVARLGAAMTNEDWFSLTQRNPVSAGDGIDHFEAPAALVCDTLGRSFEILGLVGPRQGDAVDPVPATDPALPAQYRTASWLRGLYATISDQSWAAGSLVIGRWPRYPSALPESLPSGSAPHLQSRTYAWIGFPWSLHQARFDQAVLPTPSEIEVLPSPSAMGLMRIHARALATGFDWTQSTPDLFVIESSARQHTIIQTFEHPHFKNTAVTGCELRIFSQYSVGLGNAVSLPDAARNGNSTAVIGKVQLRCRAPALILANEQNE